MSDPLHELSAHFAGLWVRQESQYGQIFAGRDSTGVEVSIAVLSAVAAGDPSLRNTFADAVWRHSVGSQAGRASVYAADLHAARPWAAIRTGAGQAGAERLLDDLASTAPTSPIGQPMVLPAPPGSPAGYPADYPAGYPASSPAGFPANPPGGPAPPLAGAAPAGYPGGPGPAAPAGRRSSPWPWLLGVGGGVMALVLLVAGTAIALRVLADRDREPTEPVEVATAAPTGPAPTEQPGPETDPEGRPILRPVDPVSVLGPTFGRNEETFTMQFPGWPFAFRTPPPWNCLKGEIEIIPEAEAWVCAGESGSLQRVNVVLWECETGCDEAERREMLDTWLDEPELAVKPESMPTVSYVETSENDSGRYSVDLGHFFGEQPGEPPLRWLVGVYVESPPETRDDVLKVLNDIVTQTS